VLGREGREITLFIFAVVATKVLSYVADPALKPQHLFHSQFFPHFMHCSAMSKIMFQHDRQSNHFKQPTFRQCVVHAFTLQTLHRCVRYARASPWLKCAGLIWIKCKPSNPVTSLSDDAASGCHATNDDGHSRNKFYRRVCCTTVLIMSTGSVVRPVFVRMDGSTMTHFIDSVTPRSSK
jgi:hypothetical protein